MRCGVVEVVMVRKEGREEHKKTEPSPMGGEQKKNNVSLLAALGGIFFMIFNVFLAGEKFSK